MEKREELLKLNVNPYPYDYRNSVKILDVIEKAEMDETTGDKNNFSVKISGRIWAKRDMGKTGFMDLKDNTAKIQLYLNEKMMVNGGWDLLPFIDMSDIIGVSGDAFKTRKGELFQKYAKESEAAMLDFINKIQRSKDPLNPFKEAE